MGTPEEICYKFVLSVIICLMYSSMSDASCSLPQDLRNAVWEYNYTSVSDNSTQSTNLNIATTTLQNSVINLNAYGTTVDDWTCINSLNISITTTVVVFKSDTSFTIAPGGDNHRLYLCMKLTKITADLYYFYLLSDINTSIDPNERAFMSADNYPMSSTVCQYTDSPKIRTLRSLRQGTNDVLPNDASLCEPWDSACDVDDKCNPNPCQNNGTCVDLTDSFNCTCAPGWEDDNCTTVMTCDYPNTVPHATIITSGNELDDTITFICAVGYENISGDTLITCRSDGYWEGSPINCTSVTCPNPSVVTFAVISSQTGSHYLDKITYTCDTGYERIGGNLVRTCKEDKLWDGLPLVCTLVSCPNPPVVSFATISAPTGSNYNDTITYACNIGYERTGGTLDRTCKENKLWDGIPPVCTLVSCPNPPVLSFATISAPTGSNYNDTITYTCNIGYERTGGTFDRTCKENKLWDGIPPVCTIVTCPNPPSVSFATISAQTGSNYNDTIRYTCSTGYERTAGNQVRTCKEDKKWDGIPPLCSVKITKILKQNSGPIIAGGLISSGFLLVPIAFCCLLKRRSKDTYMDTSTNEVINSKQEEDYHEYSKPSETYQIYRGRQYGYEATTIQQ